MAENSDAAIIIKKYANRRLYDTSQSTHVTLNDIRDMVLRDVNFRVIDATTNNDITSLILSQVIVELELQGCHFIPDVYLKYMIKLSTHPSAEKVRHYFETLCEMHPFTTPEIFPQGAENPWGNIAQQQMEWMRQWWGAMPGGEKEPAKKTE